MTTIRTHQKIHRQESVLQINRRGFLASSGAAAAFCAASAIPSFAAESEQSVEPNSLYWNNVHILWQLLNYRRHLLHWLLRRNRRDARFWYTGLKEADGLEYKRFRATVDGLIAILNDPKTQNSRRCIAAILRPARASLCASAGMHLLREHQVDEDFVTARCICSGPGLIWQWRCRSMGCAFPENVLASYWEEIRDLIGLPAHSDPYSLFAVKSRRLIRCFRRLSADDYFRLAYPLVQMYPAIPPRFFAIPDEWKNGQRRVAGRSVLYGGPGIRDRVSHLMGVTLEFLANDDFTRLWPLVKRVEMCGSWMPCIAGQVLDILYQKALALLWLHRHCQVEAGPNAT